MQSESQPELAPQIIGFGPSKPGRQTDSSKNRPRDGVFTTYNHNVVNNYIDYRSEAVRSAL